MEPFAGQVSQKLLECAEGFCRTQFKLVESLMEQEDKMNEIMRSLTAK